jgi:hypothetical protein
VAQASGQELALNVSKIVAGTLCGIVAYKAQQWGTGPQATYVVWTLIGLASSFYFSFLTHVLAESIKGRASASTLTTTTASRGLVTSLLIATTAALLARFGQAPLLILVSEEHKNQLLMFLLALIWLALAVMAPIGAGLSSVFAIENAHILVDRWAGERPIYDFLAVVAGLGMFAFTGYLVYAGYMYGALMATKMGIWPWPTNG